MAKIKPKNQIYNSCLALYRNSLGFEDSKLQKMDLNLYAKNKGLEIDTFIDVAELGTDSILEHIIKHSNGLIICWRLDCLPKEINSLDKLVNFLAILSKENISFISLHDGLDTDVDAQNFLLNISSSWISFKRNRKIQNARASFLKAKNRNNHTGRKKIRDDHLIHNLRVEGLTIREIASKIGLSTTAVQRSLKTFKETPENQNRLQSLV